MSAIDPFGGCHQKRTMSAFNTVFLYESFPTSSFYRTQVNLGSDLWVRMSVREWVSNVCADLTDVTLADDDTNSILADNAKRAIQGNEAMQVM